MSRRRVAILCGPVVCFLVAQLASRGQTPLARNEGNKARPTAEEAKKYIENAETALWNLGINASRASWVEENFITEDTETIAANANEVLNTASTEYAKEAHRFDGLKLEPELARKRLLLELAAGFPARMIPRHKKSWRISWRPSMATMARESGARTGKKESAWTSRRWGN